jgi:hypothetical protein
VGRQFHRQRKILPRQRKILPRVTLNLGTRLSSVGVGRRGARVSAGKRETTATLSLIGTGLAYGWHRKRRSRKW